MKTISFFNCKHSIRTISLKIISSHFLFIISILYKQFYIRHYCMYTTDNYIFYILQHINFSYIFVYFTFKTLTLSAKVFKKNKEKSLFFILYT